MDLENAVETGSQDAEGETIRILVRRTTVEVTIVEVLGDSYNEYTIESAEAIADEIDDDSLWNITNREYEAIRSAREAEK
jgi:hypothetical protein